MQRRLLLLSQLQMVSLVQEVQLALSLLSGPPKALVARSPSKSVHCLQFLAEFCKVVPLRLGKSQVHVSKFWLTPLVVCSKQVGTLLDRV